MLMLGFGGCGCKEEAATKFLGKDQNHYDVVVSRSKKRCVDVAVFCRSSYFPLDGSLSCCCFSSLLRPVCFFDAVQGGSMALWETYLFFLLFRSIPSPVSHDAYVDEEV